MPHTTPVAIVGGGPVGLVLALFLDHYGVRCTLFNTSATARPHPKGNGQNARTMEHYRQLGLSDAVRALGLPDDHPFDQAYFTRLCAWEIHRNPCPSWAARRELRRAAPAADQYPEPMFHVNQMYVEALLLERVRACANVELRFGWEVLEFEQGVDEVRLWARPTEGDGAASEEWVARHMVDCSGGRSTIRKRLGIEFVGDVQTKDAYFAGRFYTVWLRIPELYPRFVEQRRAWMYWAVNPDKRSRGILIALNGKDEFSMMVKPQGGAAAEVKPDEVASWVRQAIGVDDIAVEVLGYASWNAGAALSVDRYRKGDVFLAGDAAHLFTPVGGFGMNTGIDDAHNLAWKLAASLQGWGGPALLASYDAERRPIGFRNTGAARKYSSKMRDPDIPDRLEEDSAAGEEARRQAAKLGYVVHNHFNAPEERDCTGVQLGARYDGSPLVVSDGSAPPEDDFDVYRPSGVPGGRCPHLWLDDEHEMGGSLYDQLGSGFTLLRIVGSGDVDTGTLETVAAGRGVPLKVLDVTRPEAIRLYERALVLVRPDQYIVWRGDALPDDCGGLLDRVCGFV